MSISEWVRRVPRPRAIIKDVGRAGSVAAVEVTRRALARADQSLPEPLRRRLPEMVVEIGGVRYRVHGLRVERLPDDPPEPTPDETSVNTDGFFDSLPRGARAKDSDEQDAALPTDKDTVKAWIDRTRDLIDNLDDVEDFAVVEAVDDDMYQLWRELERKMQKHRQSEAKHQLKDMFDI